MKLSFSTLGCPDWSADQIIDAARTNGYDGVQLRFMDGERDIRKALTSFPGGPREFRRKFERVNVALCCLDTSVVLTADESGVSEGEQMIDLALNIGAPYLRVFGGEIPDGETRPEATKRAAEKLARLGRRAAQRGLRVLLETHDAFSSGAHAAQLLSEAGDEGTGVIWDFHHPVRMGETPAQTARLIGTRTYHVHVKDAKRDGALTLMGEGDIPTKDLLAELHKLGYQGFISLEWEKAWHPEIADPEIAFPHAARYLSDLFLELGIPRG
jgi:sugar phosphate isomerase/epimerase